MQTHPSPLLALGVALSVVLASSCVVTDVACAQAYDKDKVYRYLKAQQDPHTGLVNSFTNTADEMLWNQASTYDQALAAITFLLNNDADSAARILNFFNAKWVGVGFANFYHTQTGDVGIESTTHLGPNAWIALAALHYDHMTGKRRFYDLAYKIAVWMMQLPHDATGGIAMGSHADWGANWREVFSAENNIDALAVFRGLQSVTFNKEDEQKFAKEVQGIKRFLKEKIFARKPRIPVGPDTDIMATDVFAFAVLAFKPSELENDLGVLASEMFDIVEKNFSVATDDIVGYDFTDFVSKGSFDRRPMISIEWSAMIALAYSVISDHDTQLAQLTQDAAMEDQARAYAQKTEEIVKNLDQKAILYSDRQLTFPYATKAWEQVFPFAPWWRTPQRGDRGRLAGSLSGTCWRVFVEERFNPFYFTRSR